MAECLTLAARGAGHVSPNPMVGCVIVKGSKIVGRGFHARFGGPHAEVSAIRSAGRSARGATLFVNLEPCNHWGKTPPCTELIIESGIREVVVAMGDPNPLVSGRGVRKLRRAGIHVRIGILARQARRLNEAFAKYVTTGLPFVTLKIAQTLDGRIANSQGRSKWITNAKSRTIVHAMRARADAVLVGARTISLDDPLLTVRRVHGRNPVRVVLDGRFSVPPNARVFRTTRSAHTMLFVSQRSSSRNPGKRDSLLKRGVEIVTLRGRPDHSLRLREVLAQLGQRGISSLLVEGGGEVFSTFLRENQCDKICAFIAPTIFGNGRAAIRGLTTGPVRVHDPSVCDLDGDMLIEGYLH